MSRKNVASKPMEPVKTTEPKMPDAEKVVGDAFRAGLRGDPAPNLTVNSQGVSFSLIDEYNDVVKQHKDDSKKLAEAQAAFRQAEEDRDKAIKYLAECKEAEDDPGLKTLTLVVAAETKTTEAETAAKRIEKVVRNTETAALKAGNAVAAHANRLHILKARIYGDATNYLVKEIHRKCGQDLENYLRYLAIYKPGINPSGEPFFRPGQDKIRIEGANTREVNERLLEKLLKG